MRYILPNQNIFRIKKKLLTKGVCGRMKWIRRSDLARGAQFGGPCSR